MAPNWTEDPPASRLRYGNPAEVAKQTIDEAMAATKPWRLWYGAPGTRSLDAFDDHAADLGQKLDAMTIHEVETLEEYAESLKRSTEQYTPRTHADAMLIHRIGETARSETERRYGQAADDVNRLARLGDPAKIDAAVAEMSDEAVLTANRHTHNFGSNSFKPLTITERRACNAVQAAMVNRHGKDITGRTKDQNDRIPTSREKNTSLLNDMRVMHANPAERTPYLTGATPAELREIIDAVDDRIGKLEERAKHARPASRPDTTRLNEALEETVRTLKTGTPLVDGKEPERTSIPLSGSTRYANPIHVTRHGESQDPGGAARPRADEEHRVQAR